MDYVTRPKRSFRLAMLAIAITVGIIDQITKIIVLARLEPGVAYPIIGDWFRFFLIFNSGAAFSFGQGMTWIFTLIQLGYIIAIAFYAPRIRTLATAVSLALVAGGALGNLTGSSGRQRFLWGTSWTSSLLGPSPFSTLPTAPSPSALRCSLCPPSWMRGDRGLLRKVRWRDE